MYGDTDPFRPAFESSISFTRSIFQNFHAPSAVIDVALGGIVQFVDTLFRGIDVPDDVWVAAATDDGLMFNGINLTSANRDVARLPVQELGSAAPCAGEYLVPNDLLYDTAFAQFNYGGGACLVGGSIAHSGALMPYQMCSGCKALLQRVYRKYMPCNCNCNCNCTYEPAHTTLGRRLRWSGCVGPH